MKGVTITAAQLHRTLSDWGCPIRRAGGRNHVAVVNNIEVTIPSPGKEKVGHDTLRPLAHALECSQAEVLDVLFNRTLPKGGKPKATMVTPVQAPTRAELVSLTVNLRAALGDIEEWVLASFGTSDLGPEATRTALKLRSALLTADRAVQGWPPNVDTPEWEAPDDRGYHPTRVDPVLTGVARATGLTATAVTRGRTLTHWQHNEAYQHCKPFRDAVNEIEGETP